MRVSEYLNSPPHLAFAGSIGAESAERESLKSFPQAYWVIL
jgi:hypothetical protein